MQWPNGIKVRGEVRGQFCHVIDVAQTVLEAAGLPMPTMVNEVLQKPMEGVPMQYTFDKANAEEGSVCKFWCRRNFESPWFEGGHHSGACPHLAAGRHATLSCSCTNNP